MKSKKLFTKKFLLLQLMLFYSAILFSADLSSYFSGVNPTKGYKAQSAHNPMMTQRFGADPYAMVYNDEVFVYMTNDVYEYDGNGNYVDYIDGTDGLIADVYETNVDQAKGIGPIAVKPNKRIVTDEPTLKNYIARYKMHTAHLEKHPEQGLMLRKKIREAEEAILEIVTVDDFLKDMERANLYKYM